MSLFPMESVVEEKTPYRWVILAIAWAVIFFLNYNWYLIPSLERQLTSGFGISTGELYLLLTAPTLAAALMSIVGGIVGDRLGVKNTVTIGTILGSFTCVVRVLSVNFLMLWITMFSLGVSIAIVLPNLPKMVGEWFPEQETGRASGIYVSSMGVGISLGLMTGTLFSSWQEAFSFTGLGMVLTTLVWASLAREPPDPGGGRRGVPMRESVVHSIKSKNIWLLAVSQFLFLGGFIAYTGGLTHALQEVFDLSAGKSGALSSLAVLGMVAGNLLWSAAADRTGGFKPLISVCAPSSGILLFLAWVFAYGVGTWVFVFIGGILAGGVPPLLLAYPPLLPEIGSKYAGGASGIMLTSGNLGGLLVILTIFSPLSGISYDLAFLAVGVVFCLIAPLSLSLAPLRERKRIRS